MSPTPTLFLGPGIAGRPRFAHSLLAVTLVLTAASRYASAQTIIVPTVASNPTAAQVAADSAALAAAIAAAAPGSVLWIQGGTYDGPFVIDKPLTLVASPQAHLRNNPVNAKPCLELAGTGSGAVRIAGFKLGKNVPSVWGFSSEPAIVGQGFDELDIVRCIVGPGVMSHVNASGDSAVSVSIPLVVVSNSELTGQANNNWNGMAIKNFPTLVVDGTAIVLDSSVKGADAVGLDYLVTVWWGPIPNCPCPDLFGDKNSGGDGIHATKAFHVNSEIAGGKGGAVTIQLAGAGKQPDGLPFGASTEVVALPDAGISTSAALAIGSSWTLDSTWTAELYGALGVTTPWEVLGPGSGSWAFIKPRHIAHLTPAGLTVAWPGDASWIGTPLAMQAYDPVLGLSRPVFDIFMP